MLGDEMAMLAGSSSQFASDGAVGDNDVDRAVLDSG